MKLRLSFQSWGRRWTIWNCIRTNWERVYLFGKWTPFVKTISEEEAWMGR